MLNKKINAHVAVISHKRESNIHKIQDFVGDCTFYVNVGERLNYLNAGAATVLSAGTNICEARNKAIDDAVALGVPSIQISDDLKSISLLKMVNGRVAKTKICFEEVAIQMICELKRKNFLFGGVAVSTNTLNYTGIDFSYDKLIVNDFICMMPSKYRFDVELALKEDYDMTIRQILEVGGVVRMNNIICDFPHRENIGGANEYRDAASELLATKKLMEKHPYTIVNHKTRPGQVALNYKAIREPKNYKLF